MKFFLQRLFGSSTSAVLSPSAEKSIAVIADNSDRLANIANCLGRATFLPLPVQTFPTTDDFTWEKEKNDTASLAEQIFSVYERDFTNSLSEASENVLKQTRLFFASVQKAANTSGEIRSQNLKTGLESLLPCSPKKITAEFQKQALEAGWAYVYAYNCVIDKLAETYPRCRAGIFASRMKYSDVIQIAEEILTTLRACSTLMDDLQRRYELLESLQNTIQADLENPECDRIWESMKESARDIGKFGKSDEGFSWLWKRTAGRILGQVGNSIANATATQQLQIQGQMQRTERILVFFSTTDMFQEGWNEWQKASEQIIKPNLKIMFELKRDFFRNQVFCLCDLITYNGNSLTGLPNKIKSMCNKE